jgi:hypothetical protein
MNPLDPSEAPAPTLDPEREARIARMRAQQAEVPAEPERVLRMRQHQTTIADNETPDRAREADTLRYLGEAHKRLPPQQAEEIINYSASMGIPADTVERNLDEVRKKARTQAIDYEGIARDHPVMAR